MKVKLVLLFLFSLMIFNCKEEKKIEIVPNLEAEYFAENEVDKQVEYISDKDDSENKSKTDLIEVIKSIHDSKAKDTLRYIIKLRLYINESGRIEKVKDISTIYDKAEYSADGIRNYTLRHKMNEALALKLAELQFHPAIKEGKKVKSWTDIKNVNVLATPDGKFEIEMPDFLSGGMFGSKDEYLIVADEMPEIIGGMYSIQKNIRYPELAKRAGIEGTISEGVRSHELRHTRYVGMAKTHLQHLATATAINLARYVAWRRSVPLAATRVSRFKALLPSNLT